MTVQNYTAWGSANGSGITGPYNIPFPLYSQSHATILLVTNNVPTFPNLGTDYTFTSWSPLPNGQVVSPQITFTADVPNGTEIIFLLTPPGTQETAITNYSDYMPELHEQEFDLLAQKTLQLFQWAGKSIKAPDWEYAGQANLTLPPIPTRAGNFLAFDANGNLIAAASAIPQATVSPFVSSLLLAPSQQAILQTLGLPVGQTNINLPNTSYNNVGTGGNQLINISTTNASGTAITGIVAPTNFNNTNAQVRITIYNNSANNLTLVNASSSSAFANQIFGNNNSNLVLLPQEAVDLVYSNIINANGGWIII